MESFVTASRLKVRFETSKGLLTVEDLWDLPLDHGKVTLDEIAIGLHNELKGHTESFVHKEKSANTELQVKFDVVLAIIGAKIKERDDAAHARIKAEKKQQILESIARKESKDLEEKSLDDLKSLLANL